MALLDRFKKKKDEKKPVSVLLKRDSSPLRRSSSEAREGLAPPAKGRGEGVVGAALPNLGISMMTKAIVWAKENRICSTSRQVNKSPPKHCKFALEHLMMERENAKQRDM